MKSKALTDLDAHVTMMERKTVLLNDIHARFVDAVREGVLPDSILNAQNTRDMALRVIEIVRTGKDT